MKIVLREITPEEKARRQRNMKRAKLILIKIPLVLWILFAVGLCCVSIEKVNLFTFFAVLIYTGIFVIPWCVLANFIINHWYG